MFFYALPHLLNEIRKSEREKKLFSEVYSITCNTCCLSNVMKFRLCNNSETMEEKEEKKMKKEKKMNEEM